MTAAIEMGGGTPRAHDCTWGSDGYAKWLWTEDDNGTTPAARHARAVALLPSLAYVREWGKQWQATPARKARRSGAAATIAALKARIAELEAAFQRFDSILSERCAS
jgi:hypothetical protein